MTIGRNDDLLQLAFRRLEAETDKAWLVVFDEGIGPKALAVQRWLPRSECHIDEDALMVEVPRWLVEAKGLESYVDE